MLGYVLRVEIMLPLSITIIIIFISTTLFIILFQIYTKKLIFNHQTETIYIIKYPYCHCNEKLITKQLLATYSDFDAISLKQYQYQNNQLIINLNNKKQPQLSYDLPNRPEIDKIQTGLFYVIVIHLKSNK